MLTLTTLHARLRVLLNDPDASLYSDALLDEAALLALDRMQAAAGQPGWTVSGLDGAALTSLPVMEEGGLLTGAAAHAVSLRALGRSERFDLSADLPDALLRWSRGQYAAFSVYLEGLRLRTLQKTPAVPYLESGGWQA